MKRTSARSDAAGFSLIELMISIVLGLLLIAGAIATYLASKRSYSETEAYSAITDNARFAELTIADALLHVGFFGEASPMDISRGSVQPPATDCGGPHSSNGQGSANVYNFERDIYGATIDASGTAVAEGVALTCIVDGRKGTDVLIIKRAVPSPITDGARNNPLRSGKLDTPNVPQAGTIYVLSNNATGILFDGGGTPPSIDAGGDVYHGIAWPYLFEAYYIRDKDPNSEADPPVLARKTLVFKGGAMVLDSEDLIEGVEDMQLRIGLDSDNDKTIDKYSDVADMANGDWARAASIEVYLLVRSSTKDPQFNDTKTYHMGGSKTVTPVAGPDANNDLRQFRRLRVYTQASLRNPQLVLQR
jgi:type IV pilus assembly protein PilW